MSPLQLLLIALGLSVTLNAWQFNSNHDPDP